MDQEQRHAQAQTLYDAALERVRSTPYPADQKYPPGTRVRIADDLGPSMSHFPRGRIATVSYTYAHAYGGSDVKSYCLDIDFYGSCSWYYENQLTKL